MTPPIEAPVECTGLILAGGKSRRFGSNKANYLLNGKPMIEWVYASLAHICPQILIATTADSHPYNVPAKHIVDVYDDAGPLAGLHAGIQAAQTPWVIAVPVDMPYLKPSLLVALTTKCTDKVDAIICRDKFGLQPFPACYHTRLETALAIQLEAQRYTFKQFLDSIELVVHDLPAQQLININTPNDLSTPDAAKQI